MVRPTLKYSPPAKTPRIHAMSTCAISNVLSLSPRQYRQIGCDAVPLEIPPLASAEHLDLGEKGRRAVYSRPPFLALIIPQVREVEFSPIVFLVQCLRRVV